MKYVLLCLLIPLCVFASSKEEMYQTIGDKIWKNECGGTLEGLTCWNAGEQFPSLGIGHFIWYPKDKADRFEETFPQLLTYLEKEGVLLPAWLKKAWKTSQGAPWNSREDFYAHIHSSQMRSLRQFLSNTKRHQAMFIGQRVETLLPQLVADLPETEQQKVSMIFHQLMQDPRGMYALIDYVNFKGTGLSPTERYKGQGWGLLQVLQRMPTHSEDPVDDFVESAKLTLKDRIKNGPPEKNEGKWLKGWLNRVSTYLN